MTVPSCDFCQLPVSAARGVVADRTGQPVYCCFGCEFAAEVTRSAGREGANRVLLLRVGLAAFCTMNVLAFTMVLWSHDIYPATQDARAQVLDDVLRYLGLLFSLPVWFVLGQPMLLSAVGNLRRGIPATDFLVCLGVLAAFGFSMVSTWRGSGAVYYEVACVILVLITLGRWLELQGKLQASSAIDDLEQLLPATVRLRFHDQDVTTPLSEIRTGDRLRIHAGECFGVDGVITSGCANVDERLLTGESWPVEKRVGDTVRAGAFNLDGQLEIAATSTAAEGSLGRVVRSLREARQQGGHYERLAERLTNWFLPAIVCIALAAVGWHGWFHGIESGVMTGLAVLLIACPCALGLATPLASWTAFSHAAHHQVLFRSGEALERLAGVKALAWDKTGTLTSPQPVVETIVWATETPSPTFLAELVELARGSNHPFSRAVANSYGHVRPVSEGIGEIREQPGRGISGRRCGGGLICLGNQQFADELGLSWTAHLRAVWKQIQAEGRPVIIGGADGSVQCLLVIKELLRSGAADAVYQLQTLGIHQQMLTGDHALRATRLVQELFASRNCRPAGATRDTSQHIFPEQFTAIAGLMPDQKQKAVQCLKRQYGPVAMVGDGVNDALALTAADVGIALRSGADISRDSADVCLFGDDVRRVPWAIDYARFAVRIIRQNLFWAFGYNTVGVTLAAFGFLNPSLAAVLMVGSSAFVIANTWRLSRGTSFSNAGQTDFAGHDPNSTSTPSEKERTNVAEKNQLRQLLDLPSSRVDATDCEMTLQADHESATRLEATLWVK